MRRPPLIPLIVACALFMENMDSTVLATSLPSIAADLGENPLALKLALVAYLVSLAVFIPVSGWVADRIGSKTVFAWAIVVYMAGSLACGASSSLGAFVASRFLQGLGGAMMVPVGRLVILKSIPKDGLVRALTWLTIPATLGPLLGPPLGGFISEYFHWRGIFLINVPISILGLVLVIRYIPNLKEERRPPLDLRGFTLSGLGLSLLLLGLSALGGHLLDERVIAAFLVAGSLILFAYWRHSKRAANPILDLSLFRNLTYRAGVLGGTLFRIGAGAVPFLLPLLFQLGFGMGPLQSGLLSAATGLGSLSLRTMTVVILRRFGFRRVLIANAAVSSAAIAGYGLFTADTPFAVIFVVLLLTGSLRALHITFSNSIWAADIARDAMSRATSLSSMAQRVSTSLGVAVGAYALELSHVAQGHGQLVAADFWPAFLFVGLVSACSIFFHVPLPKNAGAEMSGHMSR
jgi:EmrB/QacA subfamily drug resistance transporter